MKKFSRVGSVLAILLVAIVIFLGYYFWQGREKKAVEVEKVGKTEQREEVVKEENIMKLTSPAFENNEVMPSQYTCDGENINPPLEISQVPAGTKILVLTVDDPDAPSGSWNHWLVWNIPSTVSLIEEDDVPEEAIQGISSFDKQEYGGPCPPSGTHHYIFKIFALDTELSLETISTIKEVEKAMEGHIIDQAEIVGLYQRER